MREFVLFLHACASSGTLLTSLCALVLVPFFAWGATRVLAPFILRMNDDAAWQAPLASIAATIPGALFLALASIGLAAASSSGCLQFLWGRILFAAIASATALALTRAVTTGLRRNAEVRRLIALCGPPPGRVSAVAQKVGVRVRVFDYHQPFCALAQPLSPLVVMSRATLQRLNDDELEAALRHEAAHARRGDLMLAAALHFFADLLPLPTKDLIDTYARAREFAADEHAAARSNRETLASAILALASKRRMSPSFAGLAEDPKTVRARISALLQDRAQRSNAPARRFIVVAILVMIVALSFAPVALGGFHHEACTIKGMSV